MSKTRALVLTGYGLNCDHETAHAFRLAGAQAERVHINSLIDCEASLDDFQIMTFIGGFSWGDDHGAGVVQAVRMKTNLRRENPEIYRARKPGPRHLQRLSDHREPGPVARNRRQLPRQVRRIDLQRLRTVPRRLGVSEDRPRFPLRLHARHLPHGTSRAPWRRKIHRGRTPC